MNHNIRNPTPHIIPKIGFNAPMNNNIPVATKHPHANITVSPPAI